MGCGLAAAEATTSEEATLLALTNRVRTSARVHALTNDAALSSVARWWAAKMAEQGTVSHNPDIGLQIAGWSRLAENVAVGANINQVHEGLLASPSHHANLSNPAYSLVGIGVAFARGRLYVVENFGAPAGGRLSGPTPDPRPLPTTARRSATTTMPASGGPPEPPAPVAVGPIPDPEPTRAASTFVFALAALRALDSGYGRR